LKTTSGSEAISGDGAIRLPRPAEKRGTRNDIVGLQQQFFLQNVNGLIASSSKRSPRNDGIVIIL